MKTLKALTLCFFVILLSLSLAAQTSCNYTQLFDGTPSNNFFGNVVDVTTNRVIVGSNDSNNGSLSGAVYIYDWNGTSWVETKITASDGEPGDRFGTSISIDGDRAIVGASHHDLIGNNYGAAYIYDWDGSNWIETKIIASDGANNDSFGTSVSVDGNRVVVGSVLDDVNAGNSGSAYIYDWDGTTWNETKIAASNGGSFDSFGHAVSNSGDRVLVGTTGYGNVYLYEWNGVTWVESEIQATDGTPFGRSLDISGNQMIIGTEVYPSSNQGSAFIYDWNGTTWNETKLIETLSNYSYFGKSVSIDGDRAIVGAHGVNGLGKVFIYEWDGVNWVSNQLTAYDGMSSDGFGYGVAIDGNTVAIGAPRLNYSGSFGSAYFYEWNGGVVSVNKEIPSDGGIDDNYGNAIAIEGDKIAIAANWSLVNSSAIAGVVYVYDWDGTNWQETILSASNHGSNDQFGNAIDISGNKIVVGARLKNSVYIYDWDGINWQETQLSPANGGSFGSSVAINNDKIIVGSPSYDSFNGAAFLYEWDGIDWLETMFSNPNPNPNNQPQFGSAVDILDNRIVISSKVNFNEPGSIYVYDWDGTNWIETILSASDGGNQSNFFGESIDLSEDRIIVGAPRSNGNDGGSVYIYDWNGTNWVESKIIASDQTFNDLFGTSIVSVSEERIMVGSPNNDNGFTSGSVYIYDWNGVNWIESKIYEDNYLNLGFGNLLAASGPRTVIGSYNNGGFPNHNSSVSLYECECLNNLVLDFELDNSVYHAGNTILSTGVVPTSNNTHLKAGSEICLEKNFEVLQGAVFEATIENCIFTPLINNKADER